VRTESTLTHSLPITEVVTRIVTLNKGLHDFWGSNHQGWPPSNVADLLSRSRLDWQVSLSYSLQRWIDPPLPKDQAAVQILGYANIGSLVEGTLKLFLSVFYNDYKRYADAIIMKDPDGLTMEPLRQFFKQRIWSETSSDNWDPWIQRIQCRRNAIHSFKDRDIGNYTDMITDIRHYLIFVRRINSQLPYPDSGPRESYDDPESGSYAYEIAAPVI